MPSDRGFYLLKICNLLQLLRKKGEELRMDGKTEEAVGVIYFISMLEGFISNGRDKRNKKAARCNSWTIF